MVSLEDHSDTVKKLDGDRSDMPGHVDQERIIVRCDYEGILLTKVYL